jgi:PAS domain S-box-containing protein
MTYGTGNELDMLESALDATGVAWWWMELPSGTIFFSANKTRMIGTKADDFYHFKHFTNLVHPDDHIKMMKDMTDHIEGKEDIYETTYRIKHSDGTYRRFYDRGKIVSRKNGEITLAGLVMDISTFNLDKVKEEIVATENSAS